MSSIERVWPACRSDANASASRVSGDRSTKSVRAIIRRVSGESIRETAFTRAAPAAHHILRAVQRLARTLAVACVMLLVGLSCSSSATHTAPKTTRPYVVLLVMDEFPGDSLLGRDGRIDAVRYPNFAALAGDATW